MVSETDGGVAVTSRGTRSCSSSSVAWTIGSAWKRFAHHAVQQGVGDGGDRHALVVGHEGAHDGDALARPAPGPGVKSSAS